MKEYKNMTPEEVESFHEYHRIKLCLQYCDGKFLVKYNDYEVARFIKLEDANAFLRKEYAEDREAVQEMLEREGDLRDEQ